MRTGGSAFLAKIVGCMSTLSPMTGSEIELTYLLIVGSEIGCVCTNYMLALLLVAGNEDESFETDVLGSPCHCHCHYHCLLNHSQGDSSMYASWMGEGVATCMLNLVPHHT